MKTRFGFIAKLVSTLLLLGVYALRPQLAPLGVEAAYSSNVSMKFCYMASVPTITTAAMYSVREEFAPTYNSIHWDIKLVGQNGNNIVRDAVEAALANTSDCDILLGPGSSVYSITLSQVTALPWMDFGSTSDALSNKWTHPWFSRIIPTDAVGAKGIQALLNHYQWTKAHIVCTDEPYGQSLAAAMETSLKAAGSTYIRSCVPSGATKADLADVAKRIANSDYRVVIVVMAGWTDAFVNFVDVVAREYNLNSTRTFVYSESICSGSDSLVLIKSNFAGGFCTTPGYNYTRMQELHGRLVNSPVPPTYAPEFSDVGLTYRTLTPVSDMTYSGFTYDAYNVDAVHHCMSVLDAAQRAGTFDKADLEGTRNLLREGTVKGMSGVTTLNTDGDRVEVQMDLHTILPDTAGLQVFATFDGKQTVAVDSSVKVHFNTADGEVPKDTTESDNAESSTSDLTERNLIITFAILGALILVALLMFVCFKVANDPTRNAPTDASKPFVLIVTDIEKSTSLWNLHQSSMKKAIETHNKIVRQQIEKHGCYEVMTQGDSFTIATADVQKAVSVSEGIQLALYKARWFSDEIDTFYKELDTTRGVVHGHGYEAGWNGLRVRIALHLDLGSTLKTEAGYQYGGNVALGARQAGRFAFGGQIVLTKPAYAAMHEARRTRCRELLDSDGSALTIDVGNGCQVHPLYELRLPAVTRSFPANNTATSPTNASGVNPFAPRYPSADPSHSSAVPHIMGGRQSTDTQSSASTHPQQEPQRNLEVAALDDKLRAQVHDDSQQLGGPDTVEQVQYTAEGDLQQDD